MNISQILESFRARHNALGAQESSPDKEEFDKQHAKLWTKCDEELNKRLVKLQALESPTPDEIKETDDLLTYLNM